MSHPTSAATPGGPPDDGGEQLLLALPDVIARIDSARAHGANTVVVVAGRIEVALDLTAPAGARLYRLLTDAAERHFDTVRIRTGPDRTSYHRSASPDADTGPTAAPEPEAGQTT